MIWWEALHPLWRTCIAIYVFSIAVILYRVLTKEAELRRKGEPHVHWFRGPEWFIELVFIGILLFCPVVNTLFAIAASVAIWEDW
jgi:hypothetical protein